MDENVAGTSGWWMCTLYGRHGLAPANRLKLLPQTETAANCLRYVSGKYKSSEAKSKDKGQNIYHTPSIHRSANSPAYERMDMIYKVPTAPVSSPRSSVQSVLKHCTEGVEASQVQIFSFWTLCSFRKELHEGFWWNIVSPLS